MIEQTNKIWGEDKLIYQNDLCAVHLLHIKKGGVSSLHFHKSINNHFYVLSGRLRVEILLSLDGAQEGVFGASDFYNLGIGQKCVVWAGSKHQFKALEDTTAIEIVYFTLDPEDIQRETEGYLVESTNKLIEDELKALGKLKE